MAMLSASQLHATGAFSLAAARQLPTSTIRPVPHQGFAERRFLTRHYIRIPFGNRRRDAMPFVRAHARDSVRRLPRRTLRASEFSKSPTRLACRTTPSRPVASAAAPRNGSGREVTRTGAAGPPNLCLRNRVREAPTSPDAVNSSMPSWRGLIRRDIISGSASVAGKTANWRPRGSGCRQES